MTTASIYGGVAQSSGLYGSGTTTYTATTYFEWLIFKESATAPATPTGGSWNFTTNTGTPPTGWSVSPPVGPTNTVWLSLSIVGSNAPSTLTWSIPGPLVGSAATVAVGTTTTGAAGTPASVTNSGTSTAAVFNFTIPRGENGAVGINWLGSWSSGTTYAIRDAVAYNGSSYYATAASTNQAPPNASYWSLLAQKGANGTGSGTVTSVELSAPSFLSVSGSPVTSSGTLALSYSGTALPVLNGGTGVTTSTGSGSVVLSTSPTLVTPILGTPTSGTLTNCTGYTYANLSGTVPTWNQNTTGTAAGLSTTLVVGSGGTGLTSVGSSGNVLTSNGTAWVSSALPAGVSLSAANTWTNTQTFNGSSSVFGTVLLDTAEVVNIVGSAPSATTNLYVQSGSVQYYTTNAANNFVVNLAFSSGTSMNTALATGQSVTAALIITQGSTAYYATSVQVDGTTSGVTTKWIGGAPTAGNASGFDTYRFAVIKTGSATYTVLASLTQYK